MSTLHEQLTLAIKNTSLNIAPNTDWTVEEYHEFMAYVHAGWLWQDCGKWFEIHPDWDKPPMWCPDDDEEEDVFIKRGSKDILGFFKRKEEVDLCCSETGEIDEETGFKVMDCDLCGQGLIEEVGNCRSCNIELDHLRDGTTEDGHRCSDCYWTETQGYIPA